MNREDKLALRDRVRYISQNHVPNEPVLIFVSDQELSILQRWVDEANAKPVDSHPTLILQPAQLAL